MGKWDEQTINEFVKRLEKHYPHSQSVCNTIHKVANEMLGVKTITIKLIIKEQ